MPKDVERRWTEDKAQQRKISGHTNGTGNIMAMFFFPFVNLLLRIRKKNQNAW